MKKSPLFISFTSPVLGSEKSTMNVVIASILQYVHG